MKWTSCDIVLTTNDDVEDHYLSLEAVVGYVLSPRSNAVSELINNLSGSKPVSVSRFIPETKATAFINTRRMPYKAPHPELAPTST